MSTREKMPQKVEALYRAVQELIEEGADINRIKVADITERAGIGKGTAYEYFPNKEELISSAMLYHMNIIYREIGKEIRKRKNLEESIYFMLGAMDERIGQRDCFLKCVHILTDSGEISKKLRRKIEEQKEHADWQEDFIRQMIELGRQTGEISLKLPEDYMYLAIASKLVGYAIYITDNGENCNNTEMQKLICESLLREFTGGI